ncbi:MAG: ATP synthase F1 subunit delta [Nitrospinae bacterium]|nr:ATP synthase F1 subunit delta [Nitrospinota bacterium]MZH46081.1 ATP synthase F1 subunit delta [Nitrospinota bacterium]
MLENQVGKRYAEALSGNISDTGTLEKALENLRSFNEAMFTEPELARFFEHPSISSEKKQNVVKEICDRLEVDEKVTNMMTLLNERGKVLFLGKIVEYFEQVVDRRLNQTRVQVTSAHPLTTENIDRLKTALNKILGKTILIDTEVDESLIGGIMLRIGDQVADDTIRNRLEILKRTIEKEEVA